MDLVHEEDVALLEVGQDRRQIARPVERPDVGWNPTPSSFETMPASVVPTGPAGEQGGRRSRPGPSAVDQERELLLDPFLPDELVDPARAERGVELPLLLGHLGVDDPLVLGHVGITLPAPDVLERLAEQVLDGRVAVTRETGHRVARLLLREPSAKSASRTANGPSMITRSSAPSLSFRSRTTRCATFFPTPGTTVSGDIARGDRAPERVGTQDVRNEATLGPMPFTVTRRSKSSRSSGFANPNSVIASSRTIIRV